MNLKVARNELANSMKLLILVSGIVHSYCECLKIVFVVEFERVLFMNQGVSF